MRDPIRRLVGGRSETERSQRDQALQEEEYVLARHCSHLEQASDVRNAVDPSEAVSYTHLTLPTSDLV